MNAIAGEGSGGTRPKNRRSCRDVIIHLLSYNPFLQYPIRENQIKAR